MSSSLIGDGTWWLQYLSKNPDYDLRQDKENGSIEVTSRQPYGFLSELKSPEKMLKDDLSKFGLFPDSSFEVKVKLGRDEKHIDVLSVTDDSIWVIECKIVESSLAKIDIRQIGQAIGQVSILSYLYKTKYKENLSKNIMPAICTRTLGSGSYVIIGICGMIGVTVIEMHHVSLVSGDMPLTKGYPSIRINYLSQNSTRPFCEDWRQTLRI